MVEKLLDKYTILFLDSSIYLLSVSLIIQTIRLDSFQIPSCHSLPPPPSIMPQYTNWIYSNDLRDRKMEDNMEFSSLWDINEFRIPKHGMSKKSATYLVCFVDVQGANSQILVEKYFVSEVHLAL